MGHTHNVHGGRSSFLHNTPNNAVLGVSNGLQQVRVFNKVTVTKSAIPSLVSGKTSNLSSSLYNNGFVYNGGNIKRAFNIKLIK